MAFSDSMGNTLRSDGLRCISGAAAVILCLLALVGAMVILFARVDRKAALINIPYFLWVAFATYLNFATALIN